jgi:hypothetical protein
VSLTEQSIKDYLGEDKLKEFIKWTLHYMADLDIPKKRFVGDTIRQPIFRIQYEMIGEVLF